MPTKLHIPLTVLERRPEADGCQVVRLERPRGFHYASGQWMDIALADAPELGAKTFSFASSPTEPELWTAFREGVSGYKRALQTVRPGDQLVMTQYGGGFRLNPRRPALLVAGGIGMTSFRSMVKEAMDTRVNTSLVVVCVNGVRDFPFRAEMEAWQEQFPALRLASVATEEEGRLTQRRLLELVPDLLERDGYVAGPTTMVAITYSMLATLGVPEYRLQTDVYDGY